MGTQIQNLNQHISEFRALTAKNSVTPESLGSLLQQIVELIEQAPDQAAVDSLADMVVGLHASVSAGASPSCVYRGEAASVNISHSAKFNGRDLKYTLLVNGAALSNPYTLPAELTANSIHFNVIFKMDNDDPKFKAEVSRTVTVTTAYPRYFGVSDKATIDSGDIAGFAKQAASASAAGSYGGTITGNKYVWLCVPDSMTISEVTEGITTVPVKVAATVAVPGKGMYKCYKTNLLSSGSFNFTIK